MVDPLLVDLPTAAKLLSVCDKTLWSMTQPRGTVPAVRIGRSVRYSPAALQAWIEQARAVVPAYAS